MPGIVSELLAADAARSSANPIAPRLSLYPAKAKRVIFLYMSGGVSHLESFDYKPKLAADAGKKHNGRTLLGPQFKFARHGQCGTEISELFPHLAQHADDLCVIRSLKAEHFEHFQATTGIHTGSWTFKRPSIGSWVSYGLGTENQSLPSFVVLAPYLPYAGTQSWDSDFLPAAHQGIRVQPGDEPIRDLRRRAPSEEIQAGEMELLAKMNGLHLKERPNDSLLTGRMRAFETAFGMQSAMPEVLDLSKESNATLALYGLERGSTKGFAWQCLVARRLAERGVRFIELIDSGSSNNWDSHGKMEDHRPKAKNVDQAIAGLLTDLKGRGLLDDTLVVWTTEFGRTPHTDGPTGRSHHNSVFSSWLAGAGVRGGQAYGQSDDYGYDVAENLVHAHDFHATILHLLGLDHERLTYRHAGRDFRLTDVHGHIVKDILA
ncbi:MAG: DUF1501 domain-containing protein [Verrucomicrobia bacterium]|nr:DUF1501 domain-containing protein [Verrucomicrobiota bacterium]